MKRLSLTIFVMAMLFLLAGCGPTKAEQELAKLRNDRRALFTAMDDFTIACSGINGDHAEKLKQQFFARLESAGISGIPLNPEPCVRAAFERQANQAFSQLRDLHRDDRTAAELAEEYRRCIFRSGKDVSPTMERRLALEVARNKKESAVAIERAHGVRPATKKAIARRSVRRGSQQARR